MGLVCFNLVPRVSLLPGWVCFTPLACCVQSVWNSGYMWLQALFYVSGEERASSFVVSNLGIINVQ